MIAGLGGNLMNRKQPKSLICFRIPTLTQPLHPSCHLGDRSRPTCQRWRDQLVLVPLHIVSRRSSDGVELH